MTLPDTLWTKTNCVVIGASGGIGEAFVRHLVDQEQVERVHCLSRRGVIPFENTKLVGGVIDYETPTSISQVAGIVAQDGPLDLVIVATGLLHRDGEIGPEKSLRNLEDGALEKVFRINAFGPALVAKSFLPLMRRDKKTVFAALSARVGSISDNQIGGWYGYRAAKAALNQILRTASIEHARRWPQGVVVGLHPGTVDTELSKPFQRNVAEGKLFTAPKATGEMLRVLDRLTAADTGRVFAYDGQIVPA